MNEYKVINEKMGETVSLAVGKLFISEYNTRSTCIDQNHVESLAKKIRERGFHPKRAISVNVIRGADGSEVAYRVAAGIHRFEAVKKVGLAEIPCLLYHDLTEEEECLLDRWDNEMDEDHKPVHFLEEAEHFRYLTEVKGWSQRQISKNKNVSRKSVYNRIKIASIPEEAKKIVRGGEHARHLLERHFEDICKLSDPHIITICEEVARRGKLADQGEVDQFKKPFQPMRQSEIKNRVEKLLKKQKEGKIERTVKEAATAQLSLFQSEEEASSQEDDEKPYITRTITEDAEETNEPEPTPEQTPPEPIREYNPKEAYRNLEKKSKGMNLDRCVRWLKNAGLFEILGQTEYIALRKIEEYDLWYRGNTDEPFFLAVDPFALIAKQSGVEKEHIQKRVMPTLKKEKYLDYWQDAKGRNGVWWFSLNWDKLFEVYCKRAYTIPFEEDGLKDIPTDFTGVVRPTPFHFIRIEKGQAIPWSEESPEKMSLQDFPERTYENILKDGLRGLKPLMSEKDIAECIEKRSETEIALKLFHEMDPKKRSEIKSETAYVLGMIKKGPGAPKEFVTPREAKEKEEQKKRQEKFINELKKRKYQYFCPGKNVKHEIETIDENGFLIRKEDGTGSYYHLKDWMDIKYFE